MMPKEQTMTILHHLPLSKIITGQAKLGILATHGTIQNLILTLITLTITATNNLCHPIGKKCLKELCRCRISKTTKFLFLRTLQIIILLNHLKSLTMNLVRLLFKWLKKYLEMFFNKPLNKYKAMEMECRAILISFNYKKLIVCHSIETHISQKILQFYQKRQYKEMGN
jgi:hypothetical protein